MRNESSKLAWMEDWNSIMAACDFYKSEGRKVRAEILCEGASPGSNLQIGATLRETQLVNADKGILKYDNPTDEELREVLERAASYEGDWYHSQVTIYSSGKWTPDTIGEWTSLQQQIIDLPYSAGVDRRYGYPDDAVPFKV